MVTAELIQEKNMILFSVVTYGKQNTEAVSGTVCRDITNKHKQPEHKLTTSIGTETQV